MNEDVRRASPAAELEEDEWRPRPAEPEETPIRQDRGRDGGPVPPERLEAGWLSGEPLPDRPAAEWIGRAPEMAGPRTDWSSDGTDLAGPGRAWAAGGAERAVPPAEWIAGGETTARTPPEEPRPFASTASEEMRWAEQADRAFRRDSRRYDGGFYLY